MQRPVLRPARRGDLEDICRIWELSFGDAPETVKKLLGPKCLENTAAAELEGHVRCFMAAFDGLDFGGVRTSYIFALCTQPEFRGRGLGEAVLRETARRAFERGAGLVCLHPASESLAGWYSRLGLETLSRVSLEPAERGASGALSLETADAGEYAALRSGAPPGAPEALLRAQELFYSGDDGGLFALKGGCVCVQRTENGPEIRELICPRRQKASAEAAVLERFGGGVCFPRVLPADSRRGETHLMGLWKSETGGALTEPPYLPFTLD